jgi:hypothetical protein
MVDQAVVDAAAELAMSSQSIFDAAPRIRLVEGKSTYFISVDSGMAVESISSVFGPGGRELRHAPSPQALSDMLQDWRTAKSSEPTHYSTWGSAEQVTVYPRPARLEPGAEIVVYGTWRPTMDATSFPDEFGREHFLTIVEGAKSKLMSMPDRKWTNLQLAGVHASGFQSGIIDARIKALHANAAGSIKARPQRFGG